MSTFVDMQREGAKSLFHISPSLPPTVNGLGDYAKILGQKIFDETGQFPPVFVVPAADEIRRVADNATVIHVQRSAASVQRILERYHAQTVCLHFSGYGYARWGLCWWLVDGLTRWKKRDPKRRLLTVFHEVFAHGKLWRSSMFTSPLQVRIAKSLASITDGALTTSEAAASVLAEWMPTRPVAPISVFSNVGEVDSPPDLAGRENAAVVFGQAERREAVYRALTASPDVLSRLMRIGIDVINDVGPSIDVPERIAGIRVDARGILASSQIADLLLSARIGLVSYNLDYISKSGIVAAYAAHGNAIFLLDADASASAGQTERRSKSDWDFLIASDAEADLQLAADRAHSWYRNHDRVATARLVRSMLASFV